MAEEVSQSRREGQLSRGAVVCQQDKCSNSPPSWITHMTLFSFFLFQGMMGMILSVCMKDDKV